MKAYSYIRFSTPEQAKGDSRRRQTDLAADYCARHGLVLDTELKMTDLGVSAYRGANLGATAALGGFLRAIRDDIVPAGSVLLVESLDRISRKEARKAVRVLEEIVEAGVDVVTLNDGAKRYTKESLDGFDFIMAVLILMRANEESKTKSKRLAAAWEAKRQSGKLLTRVVPGWIGVNADGSRFLIPERAAIVRRIFELCVGGMGHHLIAKTFTVENETARAQGKPLPMPMFGRAKIWHASYVSKILDNPAVIGTLTPHTNDGTTRTAQTPVENYYPPAVDLELWDRARALAKPDTRTRQTTLKVRNILAGLARCPRCGGAMTRVWKGSGKKSGRPKLVCAWAKTGGVCPYVSVSLDAVQVALVRVAGDPLPSPEPGLDDDIRAADASLEALTETIERLVDQIERAPSAALSKRLAAHEEALERQRRELDAMYGRLADADSKLVQRRTERYRAAMLAKPLDVGAANAALREMVARVVVDYDRGSLVMHWKHDGQTEIPYAL